MITGDRMAGLISTDTRKPLPWNDPAAGRELHARLAEILHPAPQPGVLAAPAGAGR
jgi:hypothetical protein